MSVQHIRTGSVKIDRRFGAKFHAKPVATTVCGKPITALDVTVKDALANPSWPHLCPDCKRTVELASFLKDRHGK